VGGKAEPAQDAQDLVERLREGVRRPREAASARQGEIDVGAARLLLSLEARLCLVDSLLGAVLQGVETPSKLGTLLRGQVADLIEQVWDRALIATEVLDAKGLGLLGALDRFGLNLFTELVDFVGHGRESRVKGHRERRGAGDSKRKGQ